MTKNIDLAEARIYVGTYAKYNNGSIEGKWMEMSDYSSWEDFYEACRLLHQDEEDPEFMFQDWENIPSDLIGESWLSESIYDWIDKFSDLSEPEDEAFLIWMDNSGEDMSSEDPQSMYDKFLDEYQGQYSSEEDFAQQIMEECYEIPEYLQFYIDYEKYARDLFISDYWYEDGYVFRR